MSDRAQYAVFVAVHAVQTGSPRPIKSVFRLYREGEPESESIWQTLREDILNLAQTTGGTMKVDVLTSGWRVRRSWSLDVVWGDDATGAATCSLR